MPDTVSAEGKQRSRSVSPARSRSAKPAPKQEPDGNDSTQIPLAIENGAHYGESVAPVTRPETIRFLQSTAGNRAVAQILARQYRTNQQVQRSASTNVRVDRDETGRPKPTRRTYQIKVPAEIESTDQYEAFLEQTIYGRRVNGSWTHFVKDVPAGEKVRVEIEEEQLRTLSSPEDAKARQDAVEEYLQVESDAEKNEITTEVDRRYWAVSGDPPGTMIDPDDQGQVDIWRQQIANMSRERRQLEELPEEVKALLGGVAKPRVRDYEHLLRIAKKLRSLDAEQIARYREGATGSTSDLDAFERSVDAFVNAETKATDGDGGDSGDLATELTDVASDFTPIASNIKDATIALTGENPVTGEEVGIAGRVAAGIFAIPALGNALKWIGKGGAKLFKYGGRALRWLRGSRFGKWLATRAKRTFDKLKGGRKKALDTGTPKLTKRERGHEMIGEALGHMQRADPARRADLFDDFARQIEKAADGWSSSKSVLDDGTSVFVGTAGHTLVITKQGSVYKGFIQNDAHFKLLKGGVPMPNLDALKKLM